MTTCATTNDEERRLAVLRRYDILDTPPDGSFDQITAMAATLFSTPVAIISLVDTDRIWFKSHHGLEIDQIGRDPGLCSSAILQDAAYVVKDATTDPRSLANPLVAGEFGLRFYAAAPLRTSDGFRLGTLCVIDQEPREVTADQMGVLEGLASLVIDQMELRLSARRAIADLSVALQHSQMMAREIDHRVMNSLQLVSSVLEMQGRAATDPDTTLQLEIAAKRVNTVARVHRHFYSEPLAEQSCALEYLSRLGADLSDVLGTAKLSVSGEPARIASDRIMPLGLTVNELVTNAVKHGATQVLIDVAPNGDGATISVSDDGPGLPADFDPAKATGLGMRVIRGLVSQHGGRLDFGPASTGSGACFQVTFS